MVNQSARTWNTEMKEQVKWQILLQQATELQGYFSSGV